MPEDKKYNGWSNYETWAVKLWIDNEEGSYNYWQEQTEECIKHAHRQSYDKGNEHIYRELTHRLKSEHEDAMPELTGVFSDLLSAAMSEVDWYEIAQAMTDDMVADHPELVAEE